MRILRNTETKTTRAGLFGKYIKLGGLYFNCALTKIESSTTTTSWKTTNHISVGAYTCHHHYDSPVQRQIANTKRACREIPIHFTVYFKEFKYAEVYSRWKAKQALEFCSRPSIAL